MQIVLKVEVAVLGVQLDQLLEQQYALCLFFGLTPSLLQHINKMASNPALLLSPAPKDKSPNKSFNLSQLQPHPSPRAHKCVDLLHYHRSSFLQLQLVSGLEGRHTVVGTRSTPE